jgi:hypothetical protein
MTKHTKTLITFSGAGATGKTSIVEKLHSMMPGKSAIHRSIVREFYAKQGVPSEAAFLAMPQEARYTFQLDLFDYYLTALETFVRETTAEVVLCERSVFDHFAYTMYGTGSLLVAKDIQILHHGIRRFVALKPMVFYLPYPTPWDSQGADGFRARELAKDTLVDAMISKLLSQSRSVWVGTLDFSPVSARAMKVVETVWGKPS